MLTVKMPGEKIMTQRWLCTLEPVNMIVSLAREIQEHLSTEARKHGVIDQVRYKNRSVIKIRQKGNIMFRMILMWRTKTYFFCNTKQFLLLPFFGQHTKPYGVRGLSKHYHMLFDTKL